jgi:hypothetical protein
MIALGSITTIAHGIEFSRSLAPFTGEFNARSSSRPFRLSYVKGGRICKSKDVYDTLCLVRSKVVRQIYSRRIE